LESLNNVRLHAIVEGLVQGVGFRYFVVESAQLLNLTGWVRNTYDGQVEVVAEGPQADLERFLVKISRGPTSAYVERVIQDWSPSTAEFKRFSMQHTV
jgi:acylphosphatase